MKLTVLNGSPKGDTSVTMQYVHYIRKAFPEHEMTIYNISERIRRIEKDEHTFNGILDAINDSDGLLWASPVYFMLVPANFKRFLELVFERNAGEVFQDKYTAFLTTSIRFFDHTAHNYMNAICDDLNMKYVGSYSADMYDLKKPDEKKRLRLFADNFFESIQSSAHTFKNNPPLMHRPIDYSPNSADEKLDIGDKKVLVVADAEEHQRNLIGMIDRFTSAFSSEIETVNLKDLAVKGSCLGCIHCGYDNRCVYEGKDDYIEFFNTRIMSADILVWAGAVKDRYLSARWKTFFDRSFFKGHVPSLRGKQIGFIVSGPLRQIPNLRQILEGYVEMQRANPAGFVTDESEDSTAIDRRLQAFAERLLRFAEKGYIRPQTFLGVGGMKLFRDDIWGRLRFPFRADHQTYKQLGAYDFPQKDYKTRFQNALMLLLSRSPSFRREVNKRMTTEMIKPLQKELEN